MNKGSVLLPFGYHVQCARTGIYDRSGYDTVNRVRTACAKIFTLIESERTELEIKERMQRPKTLEPMWMQSTQRSQEYRSTTCSDC